MNLRTFSLSAVTFFVLFCSLGLGAPEENSVATKLETSERGHQNENWNIHFQATVVPQAHGPFSSSYQYSGDPTHQSLSSDPEFETSYTSTLYGGLRLWRGAEVYANPEFSGGKGISQSMGIAGFTNGEIYRVGDPTPRAYISRLFLRQTFGLGGESEWLDDDQNQLAGKVDVSRITLTAGKFSLNDMFDNNAYSHEPRTQFLNWALMDNGAWDYAADTRGYTTGVVLELNQPSWSIRAATVMVPSKANGMDMDPHILQAHGDNLELEYRHQVLGAPGKVRLLGYMNHAHMGSYSEAIALAGGGVPDVTKTADYRTKYGVGLNFEQEISPQVGAFLRLGWNDGRTETFVFTEIDQTISGGFSIKGRSWSRPADTLGVAYIINGLSPDHRAYIERGGIGFMVGDGKLNYALEQVAELYYSARVISAVSVAADFQEVFNPAYNQDRGPVGVFSGRLHAEF